MDLEFGFMTRNRAHEFLTNKWFIGLWKKDDGNGV